MTLFELRYLLRWSGAISDVVPGFYHSLRPINMSKLWLSVDI